MGNPSHLAVARKGHVIWNEWRRENPDEPVDFSGVDFTLDENSGIFFWGFEFGNYANFKGATFGDGAYFAGATFGAEASFTGAVFRNWASFAGATFGNDTNFTDTTFEDGVDFRYAIFGRKAKLMHVKFGNWAHFEGATFGDEADFIGATFGHEASFKRARFGYMAIFTVARFGDVAEFKGATFGDGACFWGATFGEFAGFIGATFGDGAHFEGATFGDCAEFTRATFKGSVSFDAGQQMNEVAGNKESQQLPAPETDETAIHPDALGDHASFGSIEFSQARFLGPASFAGRAFSGESNFSRAHFAMPPDFGATSQRANLDWSGVQFAYHGFLTFGGFRMPTSGWTTQMKTVTDLRRLRGIAKEIHAVDAERDLFILERQAERGILWRDWWQGGWWAIITGWRQPLASTILMFLYINSSDCGRSLRLPLAWLLLANSGCYFLYAALIQRPLFIPIKKALVDLTFASAIPFGAMARPSFQSAVDILFKDSATGLVSIPWQIQAVSAGQGLMNLILLFLLGLALRNHFKFR